MFERQLAEGRSERRQEADLKRGEAAARRAIARMFARVEACGARMMRMRNAGLKRAEASARRSHMGSNPVACDDTRQSAKAPPIQNPVVTGRPADPLRDRDRSQSPQPSGGTNEPSGEWQPSARGRLRAADLLQGRTDKFAAGGRRHFERLDARLPFSRMGRRRTARTCVRPSGSSLRRARNEPYASSGPSPPKTAARRSLAGSNLRNRACPVRSRAAS